MDDLVKRLRDVNHGWPPDVCLEAADRIEALSAEIATARALIEALEGEQARADKADAERERLALAICGGEDVPGYANAQSVEALEKVARDAAAAHMADIDRLLKVEAERDAALGEAAEAKLAKARVKVKPLVWEETQADRGDGTHEHDGGYEAETPFGFYAIDFDYFQGTWAAFGPDSGCVAQPSDDPSDAKATAQADYEARIMATLVETP